MCNWKNGGVLHTAHGTIETLHSPEGDITIVIKGEKAERVMEISDKLLIALQMAYKGL